jgi:hypothetical protein
MPPLQIARRGLSGPPGACRGAPPPGADVLALAVRHSRRHRNPLAGQLPLAACRHRDRGSSLRHGCRRALHESARFASPFILAAEGGGGFEALFDLRNLLAQGYRPFLSSDGSVLDLRPGPAQHPRRPGLQLLGTRQLLAILAHNSRSFQRAVELQDDLRAGSRVWRRPRACVIFSEWQEEFPFCQDRVLVVDRHGFSGGMDA